MIPKRWNHSLVFANQAQTQLPRGPNGGVEWGDRVRVAHLDTGYTRHPAFGPWSDEGRNAVILTDKGRDFVNPRRRTAEDPLKETIIQPPGHGTRSGSALSGLAAGVRGIAPGLPLVPCRVTDMSLVTTKVARAIGRAIDYVIDEDCAPIVNISLGFPLLFDSAMGKAVDRAYEAGIIVAAAAGQVTSTVTYPGKHRRTLAVAGITRRDTSTPRRRFKNYNPYDTYTRIDSWAPADPIHRANVVPEAPSKQFGDGTTYATLHVSAAAAMWLLKHGEEIDRLYMKKKSERWKRVEAFRRLLLTVNRLLPFKSPGDNVAQGLQIDKLLRAPLPDPDTLVKTADRAADDRW